MKLPDPLKNLILQKLRHAKTELDSRVLDLNQAAYSKLRKEIQESINIRPVEHFFTVIPLGIYNEIVANAMAITREWPETVWQTITSILDKAIDVSCDSKELKALVDEFAWDSNKHPFTLNFVDSDRFRALVARDAHGYGLVQEETESSHRQWEFASKLAQVGIINSAKYSREGVSIAIEEYLLDRHSQFPEQERRTNDNTPERASHVSQSADNCCLPNPPQNEDDWFLVIREMTNAFFKENGYCPNSAQAWVQLRTNPPITYGISSVKDKGEEAVSMDEKVLGKRSFTERWKRYTAKKPT